MGHPDYRTCKRCRRRVEPPQSLSWTRLCVACGEELRRENFVAMRTMSGPFARHWRARMAASVGGVLLDDVSDST